MKLYVTDDGVWSTAYEKGCRTVEVPWTTKGELVAWLTTNKIMAIQPKEAAPPPPPKLDPFRQAAVNRGIENEKKLDFEDELWRCSPIQLSNVAAIVATRFKEMGETFSDRKSI